MIKKPKVETVAEFIARGGQIKQVPKAEQVKQPDIVKKPTAGGPVTILSLEEADLFYGEARKNSKPKKVKPTAKIDLDALPEALRSKFIDKLKEEMSGERCEETQDSEEEG